MTVNRTVVGGGTDSTEQSPEEVAALLARAEGKTAPVAPVIEDKALSAFASEEELLAAFRARKPAEGQPAITPPADGTNVGDLELDPNAPPAGDKPGEEDGGDDGSEVTDALEAAGLNVEEFTATFLESGSLSEEQFVALEKKGYSREVAETYLEGIRAIQVKNHAATIEAAGGEEGYRAMQAWANSNVPEAEKVAYNAALKNPDAAKRTAAITAMHQRYTAATGKEAQLVSGGKAPSSVPGDTFKSFLEMREAMADKRYGRDHTYTMDVQRRAVHMK